MSAPSEYSKGLATAISPAQIDRLIDVVASLAEAIAYLAAATAARAESDDDEAPLGYYLNGKRVE